MKSLLRLLFLAAVVASGAPHLSAAERWSTDETALRMGIRSWLTLQSGASKSGSATSVEKALYIAQPAPAPAATGKQFASGQPENVSVKMQGNQATTTFQLPQPSTQVVLQWERKGGLWKIAQETLTPTPNTTEQVALSGSSAR